MPEADDARISSEDGRSLWRQMQSAYDEYSVASEALDSLHQSADYSSDTERLRLALAADQERAAFERYVGARMAFLEHQFDQVHGQGACNMPISTADRYSSVRFAFVSGNLRSILALLALALLCVTAFSLIREQKHLRNLEESRDALLATLDQTRAEVQLMRKKLDAAESPEKSGVQQASQKPHAAEPRNPSTVPPPSPSATAAKQPGVPGNRRQLATNKSPKSRSQAQRAGARNLENFNLSPSFLYRKVGPVQVLLRSIDARRGVSLVIQSDRVSMDVRYLREHHPVWIEVGSRQERVGFVLDRIAKDRIEGHLIAARVEKVQTSANNRPDLRFQLFGGDLGHSPASGSHIPSW